MASVSRTSQTGSSTLLIPMNLLQQLPSTWHWLQASDKGSLNSYSALNKQGSFIYPFGGTIFLQFSNFAQCSDGDIYSQTVKGKYSDEDLVYKGSRISANGSCTRTFKRKSYQFSPL